MSAHRVSERPRNVAEDVIHNSSLFSQSWFTGGIRRWCVPQSPRRPTSGAWLQMFACLSARSFSFTAGWTPVPLLSLTCLEGSVRCLQNYVSNSQEARGECRIPLLVCPFSAYMLLCVISFDNWFISQHLLHCNRDEINLSKYNTQHNIKKQNKKNPSAPLHFWTPLDCIVWSGLEQISGPSINNHFSSSLFIFALSKGKSSTFEQLRCWKRSRAGWGASSR